MLPPNPLQQLQAVAVGKAEIEEKQVVLARGNGGLGIAQRRNAVEPPTRVMQVSLMSSVRRGLSSTRSKRMQIAA